MKRVIALLLSAVMLAGSLPLSVFADPDPTPPQGIETPLEPVSQMSSGEPGTEGTDDQITDPSDDSESSLESVTDSSAPNSVVPENAPDITSDPPSVPENDFVSELTPSDGTETSIETGDVSAVPPVDFSPSPAPTEEELLFQAALTRLEEGTAGIEDVEFLLVQKEQWPQPSDSFFASILTFLQGELAALDEVLSPADTAVLEETSAMLNRVEALLPNLPESDDKTALQDSIQRLSLTCSMLEITAALEELRKENVTPAKYLGWSKAEQQAYSNRQEKIRQMVEPVKQYLSMLQPHESDSSSLLELLKPVDINSLLYTFQKSTGENPPENAWQITASVLKEEEQEATTLWLYPNTNPHSSSPQNVLLGEDFSLATLDDTPQYLVFDGESFRTSASLSECSRLVLFRQGENPQQNPTYLDGMTQLQAGQQPLDNDRLFIGLIVPIPIQDDAADLHGKLYLMDPTKDIGFVFVKDVELLTETGAAAMADVSAPQYPSYAPGFPSGSQEISIIIGKGANSGEEIEEKVLIFSSLEAVDKKFTKEIYADASTHSEEEIDDTPASENEPDPASETPRKLATVTFQSAEVMTYSNGYSPNTTDSLARCAFQFEPRGTDNESKPSYFIYATDNTDKKQFLKISRLNSRAESGHVLSDNYENCDPIFIENSNDMFQFYTLSETGMPQYLYFIPSWSVFTHEAFLNNVATDVDPNFILYRQCEEAFYPISSMDQIEANGKYLIIPASGSATNAATLLLYPATSSEHSTKDDSARNVVLAKFTTSLSSYTSIVQFQSTEHVGNGTLFGGYYRLKQTSQYDPKLLDSLNYPSADLSTLKTAVMLGGSVDVLDGRGCISESDITYDPDACTGVVRWEILDRLQGDTFGQLGTTPDYNGDLIPLKDCLYTFTADAGGFRISHKMNEQTTVYLDLATHGIVNKAYSDASQAPTFSISENGSASTANFVKIHQNTDGVGDLYFWGWGIFTHTSSQSLTNTRDGVSRILLYRPIKENEQSSEELNGYVNVSSVEDGEQYLIAVVYNYENHHEMYFVHPSTNGGSTNAHVAKRTTQAITGSTKIRFHAERINPGNIWGQAILKLTLREEIESRYQIDILPADTMSTAAPVREKLVIGTGTGIGGYINSLIISTGTSFHLNPADDHQVQLWLSSNNDLVSVDQTGKLTIHDPDTMSNQQRAEVTIYVLMEDNHFYTFPVTVLKNTYTRTRIWNYYIAEIVDTDVFISYPDTGVTTYDDRNFLPVQQYQVNYLLRDVEKPWGAHFFARPKPGYALYYMYAPGSNGDYKKLDNKDNPKLTEYYNSGPCIPQANIYGEPAITNMLKKAMEIGCVGAMGFTGHAKKSENIEVSLSFCSAKLATFKKTVAFVFDNEKLCSDDYKNYVDFGNDTGGDKTKMEVFKKYLEEHNWGHLLSPDALALPPALKDCCYEPGMSITNGSQIIYMLEIDHEDCTEVIQYTQVKLDDKLNGVKFVETLSPSLQLAPDSESSTIDLPAKSFYYAAYTYIGDEPINTATLTYSYRTMYQTGSDIQLEISASAALTKSIENAVQYTSLTVDQNLSANFYIDHSALFDSWKTGDYHIHFDFQGDDGAVYSRDFPILPDANASVTTTDSSTLQCQRFSLPVPAQYMATPIHMHVENKDHVRVSNDWEFTVQNYVDGTLEDLDSSNSRLATSWQVNGIPFSFAYAKKELLTKLLKDLLNYGAYTQKYLGHTTRLANDILDEDERTVNFDKISFTSTNWYRLTDEKDPMISFTGVSLETGGQNLGMRVYFRSSQGLNLSKTQGTVQHINEEVGNPLYLFNQEITIHQDSSKPFTYYVSIRDIPLNQLSCIYKVQISRKEDNGITHTSAVSLNALTYLYLMKINSGSFDESLKNLAAAIYNYNDSALKYFQPVVDARYAIG